MCDVCDSLAGKVETAVREHDPTKARVMNALLIGHRKCQHGGELEVVTILPDGVIWPGGKVWTVGRDDG